MDKNLRRKRTKTGKDRVSESAVCRRSRESHAKQFPAVRSNQATLRRQFGPVAQSDLKLKSLVESGSKPDWQCRAGAEDSYGQATRLPSHFFLAVFFLGFPFPALISFFGIFDGFFRFFPKIAS